jgi:hypothetical protein
MKYAIQMGSSGMIYIPSFISTGSGIEKVTRRDSQTHRYHGGHISLVSFFSKYGSRLKIIRPPITMLEYTYIV